MCYLTHVWRRASKGYKKRFDEKTIDELLKKRTIIKYNLVERQNMIEEIRKLDRWLFSTSFFAFIVGICAFSDNPATSSIFYLCAAQFAAFSVLKIGQNGCLLIVNGIFKMNLLFLFIMAASFFWQYSSAYYSTRLVTTTTIVLFCILMVQWMKEPEDVFIAIGCMVWANVFNCLYRFAIGGIREVAGTYSASHSLIVGANELAVTLVVVFAFSILLYRQWNRKVYLITALLFFSVGLMTASRKAVLGFLCIIVLQYALKDSHFIKNFFIAGALVVLFWVVLSNVDIFSYAFSRLQQLIGFVTKDSSVVDASSEIRRSMREIGFKAFLQKPILGYGLGYSYTNLASGTYLHNNYVELGVSLGIVGLFTFYLPHVFIVKKAFSIRNNQTLKITAIVIVFVMLIMDYGAVTYFCKFVFITLSVLFTLIELNNKTESILSNFEEREEK